VSRELLEHYAGLRHELLSRDEERELLTALAQARVDAATGNQGAPARLKRLRDRVVSHNLRLVVRIAKGFRGLPLEDRVGEGVLGLLRALDDFDPAKGFTLATYATWWIRHRIRRAVTETGRTIRVSTHVLEGGRKVLKERDRFVAREGRKPTAKELADLAGVSLGTVEAILALAPLVSLDAPAFETGEAATLHDVLSDVDAASPLDALLAKERATELRKATACLPTKEREVLEGRFGFDGGKRRTLEELATTALGGRSRERARQVQNDALRKLRRTVDPGVRLP
jgi:RNA polymerase primary sigma factor